MINVPQPAPEITVYSTAWCVDCRIARAVLDRQGVNYRWIDIDQQPDAIEVVLRLNGGYRTVPTIVFPDGRVLVDPSRRQLEQALAEPESAAQPRLRPPRPWCVRPAMRWLSAAIRPRFVTRVTEATSRVLASFCERQTGGDRDGQSCCSGPRRH